MVLAPSLFAARFDRRDRRQVRWQFVRLEYFNLERYQAGKGDAEIHRAVGTVHDRGDSGNVASVRADYINRLLDAATLGHHVLDDEDFFAGCNFESAPQHELAFLFFRKDEPHAQLPRDFLSDDQPAERGRDDGDGAEGRALSASACPIFSTTGICCSASAH